jgi:hypothetical protein
MSDAITFDTRTVRHNIRRGVTTHGNYMTHLDELEDCAEMCEETDTRFDNPFEKRHFGGAEIGDDDASQDVASEI